ncbi:hypothetical protein BP5796_08747 [Coleophoma crateriformis]|uniref:Glycosyltransferase family 69 protein n=1 Tax=Coleophoma crateriformis TaxID=565419 RepID=A0A3D8R8R9_9HELO|nr:hypothetical protein BP5796_08747 [Coleophoma crateriformis]
MATYLRLNLSTHILTSASVNDSPEQQHLREGNATFFEFAPTYINAIMNPGDDTFSRLACPSPSSSRYEYLRNNTEWKQPQIRHTSRKYFFALDLYNCVKLLPRLLGTVVEAMRYLGPENCALSIVEGRSDDGTFEILKSLRKEIEATGALYYFTTSDINPLSPGGNRVGQLAELRNQALEPIKKNPSIFSTQTTVAFLNDVAICMEDILELMHQRVYQNADMTCAMDWVHVAEPPTFYDVWIARSITGDSFFEIPPDGSWEFAWNLLWNDPGSKERLTAYKPFQVFSCWNGAVVFTAKPLLEQNIQFRSSRETECYQGEPQLFCKDLWFNGYRRITVIPSVNLEYSDENGRKIKELKGYVHEHVGDESTEDPSVKIKWQSEPPEKVKCLATFTDQRWLPWDNGL